MKMAAERDWLGAIVATTGGSALIVGALLPWMSLFAGLQSYPGVAGLYGRILLAGGALALVAGVGMIVRPRRRLRVAVGGLGVGLAALAAWVLEGLGATTRALEHHPLLLARPGAGLFVSLAGALLIASLVVPQPH